MSVATPTAHACSDGARVARVTAAINTTAGIMPCSAVALWVGMVKGPPSSSPLHATESGEPMITPSTSPSPRSRMAAGVSSQYSGPHAYATAAPPSAHPEPIRQASAPYSVSISTTATEAIRCGMTAGVSTSSRSTAPAPSVCKVTRYWRAKSGSNGLTTGKLPREIPATSPLCMYSVPASARPTVPSAQNACAER